MIVVRFLINNSGIPTTHQINITVVVGIHFNNNGEYLCIIFFLPQSGSLSVTFYGA